MDSGNLRGRPGAPCQPPRPSRSRAPRDRSAEAAGSAVVRMSSQGPQGGFQVRRPLEEWWSSSWFLKNGHYCDLKDSKHRDQLGQGFEAGTLGTDRSCQEWAVKEIRLRCSLQARWQKKEEVCTCF